MSTNATVPRRARGSRRPRIPTDRELMDLPKDGYKRELLNGEIVMTAAGSEHGRNILKFSVVLANFVYRHRLGEVFNGQTGFRMKSRDVLSPDISFVTQSRLDQIGGVPSGFFEGAPDLAVEFLSPRESKKRLRQKLAQYFENGTQLAWVMDSKRKVIQLHREVEPFAVLTEADTLTGNSVVPGFKVPVSAVIAGTF